LTQSIITIGNVNLDIIMGPQAPWPQAGTEVVLENSEIRAGGSAGNTALALEALGCRHRLFCNMGDDFMGKWLAERFGDSARDWTYCDSPTTFSVGISHPDGERTFFTNRGHLDVFCWEDIQENLTATAIEGSIILFAGGFLSPRLMAEYNTIFPALREQGARIALDTGWPGEGWTPALRETVRGWLPHCDELLFNEVEICGLFGCGEDALHHAAASLVDEMPANGTLIVKQGALGAHAWQKGKSPLHRVGKSVTVVDTIGAGDCFNAGYLMERIAGSELEECLQRGIDVASIAISTIPRRYR